MASVSACRDVLLSADAGTTVGVSPGSVGLIMADPLSEAGASLPISGPDWFLTYRSMSFWYLATPQELAENNTRVNMKQTLCEKIRCIMTEIFGKIKQIKP